ncbi:MAG: hypothetical protein OEZ04_10900, partial [Nitrospinota bacterium]|nr:hypothetical protein [Nitrospinota bacterium]
MESIFLYILGAVAMLIVIGAPAVMLLIKVQGQLEYDIINIDADKTLDLEYFRQIDKFASRHGYTREMDISVKGLAGENFNRLYTSADGSSILATQMFTQVGNFSTYIEFCSMYDEVDVCVNNAQVSNLLYNPPWSHTIQRPDITEPEKLMSLHRQACAQYGRGAIRRLEASQFASMFQQKHMRNMEYQVERGIFKKDSTGQWYRPRFKLALRGVANYL